MKNEYQYNSNFRKYVDEYCKKNNLEVNEALKDEHIKRMFWYYTEV